MVNELPPEGQRVGSPGAGGHGGCRVADGGGGAVRVADGGGGAARVVGRWTETGAIGTAGGACGALGAAWGAGVVPAKPAAGAPHRISILACRVAAVETAEAAAEEALQIGRTAELGLQFLRRRVSLTINRPLRGWYGWCTPPAPRANELPFRASSSTRPRPWGWG